MIDERMIDQLAHREQRVYCAGELEKIGQGIGKVLGGDKRYFELHGGSLYWRDLKAKENSREIPTGESFRVEAVVR